MPSDSQSTNQNPPPIPPRFRWLRLGTSAFIILFLVLVGLRTFWGLDAQSRLAEMHRAAFARGEPFYPEDFRQPSVPDSQNAAVQIQEAINQTDPMGRSDDPELDQWDPPAPGESELPAIEAFVVKYRSELSLVRTARALHETSWSTTPSFSWRLQPHLWVNRKLARILILSAKLERARGHDSRALEFIADELALTRVSDTSYPAVVTHLVTVGMSSLGTTYICNSAMNLTISEHADPGATPVQVRALIKVLLDEQSLVDGAVRDFQGERAIVIDSIPKFASLTGAAEWMMLEPMYEMDGIRIAKMRTAEAEGCRQVSWTAARRKFKHDRNYSGSNLEELAHTMSSAVGGPMDQAVQQHFRMLTERRIAAIVLAIRLYQIDHKGALPESLSELVPDYLSAVPKDPFDPADGPIRYLPHDSPPALYSVGLDGIDDHGSRIDKLHHGVSYSKWNGQDAVFSLAPTPRISPPQSQPSTKRAWWKDDE